MDLLEMKDKGNSYSHPADASSHIIGTSRGKHDGPPMATKAVRCIKFLRFVLVTSTRQ